MNSFELEYLGKMLKISNYLGAIPANRAKNIGIGYSAIVNCCIIAPGKHWIAIWRINKTTVKILDASGSKNILKSYPKIKFPSSIKRILTNKYRIQNLN